MDTRVLSNNIFTYFLLFFLECAPFLETWFETNSRIAINWNKTVPAVASLLPGHRLSEHVLKREPVTLLTLTERFYPSPLWWASNTSWSFSLFYHIPSSQPLLIHSASRDQGKSPTTTPHTYTNTPTHTHTHLLSGSQLVLPQPCSWEINGMESQQAFVRSCAPCLPYVEQLSGGCQAPPLRRDVASTMQKSSSWC